MGCDAYADENGELEVEIHSWKTNKRDYVHITGMEPFEKITVEYLKGEER